MTTLRRLIVTLTMLALVMVGWPGTATAGNRTGSHAQGLIAFTSDVTGLAQLYTIRPDGSRLRQITHLDGVAAEAPDWSPDGRRLAFAMSSGDLPPTKLAVVRPDGSGLTVLPIAAGYVGAPTFTADGRGVAFLRYVPAKDNWAVFTARLDGSREHQLTDPPAGQADDDPDMATDGKTMSFVRLGPNDANAALFTLDLRSGRERQLTTASANVAIKTGWSPSSKRIVFSRDAYTPQPGVSGNVMTISATGGHLRPVTHYEGGDVSAFAGSYSPDGRWIIYRREATNDFSLVKVHPDGTNPTTIFHSTTLRPRFIDWGLRTDH
jgi:TolB protein